MKKLKININANKAKKISLFFVLYTIAFLMVAFFLESVFQEEGKSFVWGMDGMAQHVVALKYIRNYLITFFTTGSAPMVDFSIGQGFDVIGTLNYYGFGDPVTLLTVLFPENKVEMMYEFLIFFRMYMSGVFVAYLCKTLGKTNVAPVVTASLLYAFCNYALCGGIRHPLFFNGIMYLPLIIAGVEIIIKKKKIGVLCVAVALAFVSNYYFMYMNSMVAAIYFFVRQIGNYRKEGIKNFFLSVGKIVLAYLWGTAMAAVILFPSLYAFFQNARGMTDFTSLEMFYTKEHYNILINSFFVSFKTMNSWTIPGIGALGAFGVAVLIAHHKKSDRRLLWGFAILVTMVCFPVVGKVMNGFSYSTMRFSYAIALLLAIMLAFAIDNLKSMKVPSIIIMSVVLLVIEAYLIYMSTTATKPDVFYRAAIYIGIAYMVTLIYYPIRKMKFSGVLLYSFVLIAIFNLSFNCKNIFSSKYYAYSSEFHDRDQVEASMNSGSAKMLKSVKDDTFYRMEKNWGIRNYSTYLGYNGATFYYSIVPGKMSDLYSSVGLSYFRRPFVLHSLEGRQGLLSLACVKYYANDKEQGVPYGFKKIKEEKINGKKIYLYENKNALPLGVTYTSYMTREHYEQLKPAFREQALLTSAVVDEEIKGIPKNDVVKGLTASKIEIKKKKKVKIEGNKIKARSKGKLKLSFKGRPNSQTLIAFDNINVNDFLKDSEGITFKGKAKKGKMRVIGNLSGAFYPKESATLNLGYSKEPQDICKLKFPVKRTYEFDDMYAVNVSMDEYENCINQLKKNSMTDVHVGTNRIAGKIKADQTEILQFSLPYSEGYRVYVDNQKVDTFSSSIGYMGVKINEGQHDIKVIYVSPGFVPGMVLTILSLLLFLIRGIFIVGRNVIKNSKANTPQQAGGGFDPRGNKANV